MTIQDNTDYKEPIDIGIGIHRLDAVDQVFFVVSHDHHSHSWMGRSVPHNIDTIQYGAQIHTRVRHGRGRTAHGICCCVVAGRCCQWLVCCYWLVVSWGRGSKKGHHPQRPETCHKEKQPDFEFGGAHHWIADSRPPATVGLVWVPPSIHIPSVIWLVIGHGF